jgi:glutamine---fructose-6-phosphate transaminase (isomerizing)
MCGLVGYIGNKFSRAHIFKGLSRLEYRGYDSAGFACLNPTNNRIDCSKAQGHLNNLTKKIEQSPIDGHVGIGHTRWSSHGIASIENAHPQFDCNSTISVAHNGIIENHFELKEQLTAQGHLFTSQTDTEVVAHLFESLLDQKSSLKDALLSLVEQLHGAYALVFITQKYPDQMIVVRKGSPLCLGIGDQEMFAASDHLAFAENTNKMVFLPDKSFVILKKDSFELYDFSGDLLIPTIQEVNAHWAEIDKKGYEHFMLKEIFEQKGAIHATLESLRSLESQMWQQMGLDAEKIKNLESITLIGCGTSWYAARIAQFYFEHICLIPAKIMLASEFRYMPFFPEEKSLYIAISQSGETADTLESVRLINSFNLPTVGLTNVHSSSLVREAQGYILMHAGPEIAVASTKAFSNQLSTLFWLAHRIALEKNCINQHQMKRAYDELLIAAEVLENSIITYQQEIITNLAPFYAQFKKFIFLGRNISYPFAMEAALKLKEIAYVFAQCYPAGELKHGPIALIDAETPIIIFSSLDTLIYQKLVSNAQEVKARNGHLTIFAFEDQKELIELANIVFIIPKVHALLGPLAMSGLMQFLVYQIARSLGCHIDKPRNLAKSVTIE